MATKSNSTISSSVLTASGLSGKTVTDVIVTVHGSVAAVEIVFSTGSQFIKVRQGQVEVGGTLDWGTGTALKGS
jgi:Holliday junction resolvase